MSELKFEVSQQNGLIVANFDILKSQLAEKMEEYKGKKFSEETKKEAKSDLAYLRKLKEATNRRKIEVKNEYMEPYMQFEARVKELIGMIDDPIRLIDGQIKEFEENRVRQKRAEIEAAYEELFSEELKDYIPLECIYGSKWNNAGTTMRSIRQEIKLEAEKTRGEMAVISNMQSDKVQDALILYKANRSLASAIKYITDYDARKAEILASQKEEAARNEERMKQDEIDRIRREERERIAEEERIRNQARQEAVEEIKTVDDAAAAPLACEASRKVVYTVVATPEELEEIETALTSLGIYYERKDV